MMIVEDKAVKQGVGVNYQGEEKGRQEHEADDSFRRGFLRAAFLQ